MDGREREGRVPVWDSTFCFVGTSVAICVLLSVRQSFGFGELKHELRGHAAEVKF